MAESPGTAAVGSWRKPALSSPSRQLAIEGACFLLVAAVYLAHLFLAGYDRFYYDSAIYWSLGQTFDRGGHFSLLTFHEGVSGFPRGYSLPLLDHVLQVVASHGHIGAVTIVKIFGALLAATLGVVVVPRLARLLFAGASVGAGSVLALNALIFLYWRDHFDFPLTDFPAILVAGAGLIGLLRGRIGGYLVAGLGFGLAANMRPAYELALLTAVVVAAVLPGRRLSWPGRSLAAILVVSGAVIVSAPQVAINHHQVGGWSPFVAGGKNISLLQLSDGMVAQKYETYVGPTSGYPQPQVFYLDPATQHVLQQEHVSATATIFGQSAAITGYGQYLGIVLRNPTEMIASYLRHIFNGLDVRYPTPYVRNLDNSSIVLSLLQYTLIFVALARLLLPDPRRALGRIRWAGIVVLLTACVTAVPGAVEPRFFLPLQLLIYMLVCFGPSTRAVLLRGSLPRRSGVAVAYLLFILICLTLSSETLSQLQHPGPTLD